jgi:glyoxylase-like metal-dependent hydrolase (beta-lactamase superfamily II)
MAGKAEEKVLEAYRDFCWYDWQEQTRSMESLLNYKFEWVLPGHGHRVKLHSDEMHQSLSSLIQKMKSS